jgi:hypothetical protein
VEQKKEGQNPSQVLTLLLSSDSAEDAVRHALAQVNRDTTTAADAERTELQHSTEARVARRERDILVELLAAVEDETHCLTP